MRWFEALLEFLERIKRHLRVRRGRRIIRSTQIPGVIGIEMILCSWTNNVGIYSRARGVKWLFKEPKNANAHNTRALEWIQSELISRKHDIGRTKGIEEHRHCHRVMTVAFSRFTLLTRNYFPVDFVFVNTVNSNKLDTHVIQHWIMGRPACSKNTSMTLEIEIEFCGMSNVAI